jgi:excisionase family DNA binding protein
MKTQNCTRSRGTSFYGVDPRLFGLDKAAYGVNETLTVLSIGRTTLYQIVKEGRLHPAKIGKKTLFYAADLAAFLTGLRNPM